MQLPENSIFPPLYFADILHYWMISADFIFSSHHLHLAHITVNDWYERYSDFNGIGVTPPNLGLTLKSRSQTHHSYTINWLKWNLGYA